jgi:hypothetical protein
VAKTHDLETIKNAIETIISTRASSNFKGKFGILRNFYKINILAVEKLTTERLQNETKMIKNKTSLILPNTAVHPAFCPRWERVLRLK